MNDARPVLMPKARKDQLIIKELPDETLVYDLDTDKAHCLNETAARIWKNCDGKNSVAEISASLAKEIGVSLDEGVVWLALDQLDKFKLLEEVPTAPALFAGMSRRRLMRHLGVTAIALPVIITMSAPTAEAQISCIANNNTPCVIGGIPCCAPRTCQPNPVITQCRPGT